MDTRNNRESESSGAPVELFPGKKRYSNNRMSRLKKKKLKPVSDPVSQTEETAVSDLDGSDDSDSALEQEPGSSNIMEEHHIYPTVLHAVRNGFDIFTVAFGEVALEGLDGITLEALWTRLRVATHAYINESLRNTIWNKLTNNYMFRFYELPEKRSKLQVFKQFVKQQDEVGYTVDLSIQRQDNYSSESTKIEGVFGACDSITTRLDVTDKVVPLTLKEFEVCYGNKLVIVADDKLRTINLFTEYHDPNVLVGYSDLQYRILERIGRSRLDGEVTSDKSSIGTICRDTKSLCYYRKMMEKTNVIVSQPTVFNYDGMNQTGKLLQLQRFFCEKKLKKHMFIEYLIKLLKTQPLYFISYSDFLRRIGLDQWSKLKGKSIMKSTELNALVRRISLPYRAVYPNATPDRWKKKNNNEERDIWVLQLKDPNINLQQYLSKEDPASDDSSEDDDTQTLPINFSLTYVAYKFVYDAGPEGISFKNFIKVSGIDYYTSRKLLTSLSLRKMIVCSKKDSGSQRLKNYVAVHFCHESSKKIAVETLEEVEMCDDSTIDFIANVLHIDADNKHHLKQCAIVKSNSSLIYDAEKTMGEYEAIKLMRSMNTMSADCKVIYENKHPFEKLKNSPEDVTIQLPKPSISVDNDIRTLFSKSFHDKSQFNNRGYINEFMMDIQSRDHNIELPNHQTSNEISFYNIKEIKEFYPILERQNLIQNNIKQPRFKTILNKSSKIVNKMHALKDLEDYISNISSDEEDLDNVECASMIVNFEDNIHLHSECGNNNSIDTTVKEIILNTFEIEDLILNNYILNVESEADDNIIKHITNKRSLENDSNLQITKQRKVEPNFEETNYGLTSETFSDSKRILSHVDLGPKPVVLKVFNHADCEVKVVLSSEPERFASPDEDFTDTNLTTRAIERSTTVIEFIRINKIVTDVKLIHHVQMIEKMKGYRSLLDKRTLNRNIERLISLGFIRAVKLFFKVKKFCRSILMIFLPDFILFPFLNSTIDNAIFSLRTYAKRKMTFLMRTPNANINSALPSKHIPTNPNYKSSQSAGFRYGYLPKFSRLQLIHQFIYYLIYDYSGESKCKPANLNTYFESEESLRQLPAIYKNEITWKMFIPPLPKYTEYSEGWAYIADIVLALPLSVFVKICRIVYIIPELSQYLNHPVKRHLLVKDLPLCIVDAMHCNRRYVDAIYPMFCYLCYMGLLQYGPKYVRNKFDMYVYLNKRALIYDTTTSDPGYHEVTDREYEQCNFSFDSEDEVTRFWSIVWSTSAQSKLGFRYSILGKMIMLEDIHNKQAMIETLSPITPDTVYERDVGYIPGNRRGACGYDSALWIHMRRNWTKKTCRPEESQGIDDLLHDVSKEKLHAKPMSKKKLKAKHKTRKLKRKFVSEPRLGNKDSKKVTKRVVKARNATTVKDKNVKDDLDKELQQTYSGSRAKFNRTEILALSICLEVLKYMKSARQSVSMICIRDFMHRVCKDAALKKTSSSYRRRLLYIEGSAKDLCSRDDLYLKNLNADSFAQKYFTLFLKRVKSKKVSEAEIRIAFIYLSYFTMQRYEAEKPTALFKKYLTHATVKNIELMEHQVYPSINYVQPPCTKDDIKYDTIQSLIHSCLTCVINDQNWHSVLYKSFQLYSENSIRTSVKNMQMHQILSSKKGISSHAVNEGVLLVTGKSYQLSFTYCFNQITNYPNNIFQNTVKIIAAITKEVESGTTKVSIESYENENLLTLFEISSITKLIYEIEQHTDILTINPFISDHTALIKELVRRCGIILRNIIVQRVASKDGNNFSIQNVENVISKLINCETSENAESLEGAQLIENIVENSQYLDKDADDENTCPSFDSKSIQNIQPSSDIEDNEFRNKSIYGLKSLLTKGLFPELDDDEKLEELENHFMPKYPNIWLDLNCSSDLVVFSEAPEKLRNIVNELERDAVYINAVQDNLDSHFTEEDFVIAQSLVDFINAKEIFGASLTDCFDLYKKFSAVLSFQDIMEKLINLNYIMIHGVTFLTVIHINFIENWTNALDSSTSESKYIDKTIDTYRVKLMPWMKVDGTIHIDALENWMCIILSHCLSYPQTTIQNIVTRFPYMKPVDIYTILKIIQRLGCISLNTYKTTTVTTLFSESTYIDLVPAPYHCDISNLTVSVENCAIIKLGYALNGIKTV